MAAGLGFKDFTTGEVLTAADVDGYLMQGIWVFASAAARDAAVTSPQEGNFAFLKDTNTTTYYTGSAWTNLDTTGMVNPMTTTGDIIYSSSGSTPARLGIGTTGQVLTVSGGVPAWAAAASGGKLKQLVRATSTTSYTTTSATFVDANISLTITPTSNTSTILLFWSFRNYNSGAGCGGDFQITNSSNTAISGAEEASFFAGDNGTNQVALFAYDSPATTSATTYKGRWRRNGVAGTSYLQGATNTTQLFALEIGA